MNPNRMPIVTLSINNEPRQPRILKQTFIIKNESGPEFSKQTVKI